MKKCTKFYWTVRNDSSMSREATPAGGIREAVRAGREAVERELRGYGRVMIFTGPDETDPIRIDERSEFGDGKWHTAYKQEGR